jgi:hypothetical protein
MQIQCDPDLQHSPVLDLIKTVPVLVVYGILLALRAIYTGIGTGMLYYQ